MRANQRHPWTPERIEQLENAPAIRFAKLRPLAFEAVHLARKLIRQTWWKPPDDWLSPESIDAEVKLQCETQPPSADERLRLRGKIERERKKRKAAFEAASKSKQLDCGECSRFSLPVAGGNRYAGEVWSSKRGKANPRHGPNHARTHKCG